MTLQRRNNAIMPWAFMPDFSSNFNMGVEETIGKLDLTDTAGGFVIQVALPALNVDSMEINVKGRSLTLKGEFDVPEIDGQLLHSELTHGDFYEEFTLPSEVYGDETSATYENGILTVTLPKAERTKTIKVTQK